MFCIFCVIFKEFSSAFEAAMKRANHFMPDRNILRKLAILYQPFWNIDNGISICKHCHAIEEFKKRKRNKKGHFK